jgi:hypothetical protein
MMWLWAHQNCSTPSTLLRKETAPRYLYNVDLVQYTPGRINSWNWCALILILLVFSRQKMILLVFLSTEQMPCATKVPDRFYPRLAASAFVWWNCGNSNFQGRGQRGKDGPCRTWPSRWTVPKLLLRLRPYTRPGAQEYQTGSLTPARATRSRTATATCGHGLSRRRPGHLAAAAGWAARRSPPGPDAGRLSVDQLTSWAIASKLLRNEILGEQGWVGRGMLRWCDRKGQGKICVNAYSGWVLLVSRLECWLMTGA